MARPAITRSGLSARPRYLGLSLTGFSAQSSKKRRHAAGRKDSTRQDTASDSGPVIGQEARVGTGVSGPHAANMHFRCLPCPMLDQRPKQETTIHSPSHGLEPDPSGTGTGTGIHTHTEPSGHARFVRARCCRPIHNIQALWGSGHLVVPKCVGERRSAVFERFDKIIVAGTVNRRVRQSTSKTKRVGVLALGVRRAKVLYEFAISLYPIIGCHHLNVPPMLRRQLCCDLDATGG